MRDPLSTPVVPVIGASAMLAYLFIPFDGGTKAPRPIIAATFGASVAFVTAASYLYSRAFTSRPRS